MKFLATSIQSTTTISEKAGAKIEDVRGKAVKYDSSGNVVLTQAGEVAIGIGILTNDENIEAGKDVDIQIKDIGVVCTGDTVQKGALLASDANGKLITATSGQAYIAIAMEASTGADNYIKAYVVQGHKPA